MIQAINSTQNILAQKNTVYFSAPETMFPVGERNYCLFNQNKVDFIVSQREGALPYLKKTLQTSNDEKEIVETLYIIDTMADKGVKGIPAMYPVLAKFNNTKSPNIQVFLAGIYRKTQVPDAFGPLVSMLIRNSMSNEINGKWQERCKDAKTQRGKEELKNYASLHPGIFASDTPHSSLLTPNYFDPNEEIGGAILEYIKNYSNNPKAIDYTA